MRVGTLLLRPTHGICPEVRRTSLSVVNLHTDHLSPNSDNFPICKTSHRQTALLFVKELRAD